MREEKAIRIENVLIILSIAALWPVILGWPPLVSRFLLGSALVVMITVSVRRWKRLMNLKKRPAGGGRPVFRAGGAPGSPGDEKR